MNDTSGKLSRPLLAAAAATATVALLAAGCSPTVSTHGHQIDAAEFAQITPGVTSREEVERLLGSPSTVGTFDQERWFYVSQRSEVVSFYQADITQQDVVRVDFDANGIVADVQAHGLELAQAVEPDPNRTLTLGNELSAVRQILGNIGRFNSGPAELRPQQGPGSRTGAPGGGF
jgi:outer membrane protein assembly factor BamE (lipoprotein component of BamABCDE complex)